jgi:hypothetical protein
MQLPIILAHPGVLSSQLLCGAYLFDQMTHFGWSNSRAELKTFDTHSCVKCV